MAEQNGFFTSFDGTRLFYRLWLGRAPDVLFLLHGFGEHSGRYVELAEFLNHLPLSICIFDLRGHGRSEGPRVYVESFDVLLRDLDQFRSFVESKTGSFTNKPILFGHSFGGLIATHAALKNQDCWKALILMCPYYGIYSLNWLYAGLSAAADLVCPAKIFVNPIKTQFLSRDPEEVKRYRTDSLIQRRITARMAKEMFPACNRALKQSPLLRLPVRVLAAGEDRIVSLELAKEFFKRLGSHDKMLNIFEGFYHELLHEKDRLQPMSALKEYLAELI